MNRILKQRARQLYGSRFGRLLLVFLLHFAYSSATSILPYLFQVQLERQGVNSWASFFASAMVQMVVILLFGPLLLGVCRYVYLLQKERDPGLGDVFYHLTSLGRYGRGMAAGALWNLSSCLLLLTASLMDSTGNDGLDVLLGLLMIAVYIFCIYWSLHICLLPYIVAEDENAQLGHIRRESFRLMRGNCGRFFGLLLSFIGWYLLIVVIVVIVVMAVLMPEIIRAVEMGLPTMPEELIDQYSIWINLGAFLLLTLLTPYVALTKAGFADAVLQGRMEELAWQGRMPYGWSPTTSWQQPAWPQYPQYPSYPQYPTYPQQGPNTTSWQGAAGWSQPVQPQPQQGVYSAAQQEEAVQYEAYCQGRAMSPRSFDSYSSTGDLAGFQPWLQVEQSGLYSFLKLANWMPGMVAAAWQRAAAEAAGQPLGVGAVARGMVEESLGGNHFRVTAVLSDDGSRPGYRQVQIRIEINPGQ